MHEASASTAAAASRAAQEAAALYQHLVRLRLVSARMVALQRAEKIAFHASSIGEEAAIAGAAFAMREHDWVFPGVREWGAALVRGASIDTYVHHAFGDALDPAKGHAPPDHLPARKLRVVAPSGVVGAHLPQAVGCAWAAKIRKDDVVALALFGHDVTDTGDLHNALNFAGVMKAPVVFFCRADGRRGTKYEPVSERAAAYGIASAQVDGGDAVAVATVVREAVRRASEGKGATLVEATTRPLAPSEAALENGTVLSLGDADPIVRLLRFVGPEGVKRHVDANLEESIAQAVRAEIGNAIVAAERAGAPASSSIFDHVYATVPAHLAAQRVATADADMTSKEQKP